MNLVIILMAKTQDSRRPIVGLILGFRDKRAITMITKLRNWGRLGGRGGPGLRALVVTILGVVPVEPFLIELDDDLRDLDIGLLGRHQVRLVRALPLDEEEELPGVVGGADDPLGGQAPCKAPRLVVILVLGFLLLLRLLLSTRLGLPLLPSLALFGISISVVLLDFVLTVEVLHGLPGVLFLGIKPLPLDEVLRLALHHPLVQNLLHLVGLTLAAAAVRHPAWFGCADLLKKVNQAYK